MAEQKKTRRKSKKGLNTKNLLPNMEVIFIVVFLLCALAWAFSKCSTTPSTTSSTEPENEEELVSPAAADNPLSPTYDLGEEENNNGSASTFVPPPPSYGNTEVVGRESNEAAVRKSYTPLYVTLQDLKVRKGPSRDSSILAQLNLHDEVKFLEKRTDFREKISNGVEVMNDPWLYVQTQKGHKGWVYGGGVHFFMWDRVKDPIPSITPKEIPE